MFGPPVHDSVFICQKCASICTHMRRLVVRNSSSSTLHSNCDNLLVALSLIVDGRLSTLSKRSAHLFKIVALSVRSVLPFALRCGVIWAAPSEFGTYRLCEQRRFRRACASAQSRQNLRCSLIQAVSQEEPSDRKPDPWPL